MKIKNKEWLPYLIGDMFDVHPTKAYKNLSKEELSDGGNTPFIVNSAENNGVGGYSTLNPTEKGGIITFSDTTEGNTFFVQPNDFIGFAHVQGMYPKHRKWSTNQLLFLSTILIFVNKNRYNYGRKMTRENILATTVLLPSDNNDEPDWIWIDKYISSLHAKKVTTKIASCQNTIDTISWRSFRLDKLFDLKKGTRLIKEDMEDGNVNYLGAISSNNGVRQKISCQESDLYSPNCITVNYNGSVGEAFYQKDPFWASDDVNVLYAKDWWQLNVYRAMFIITIIKANKYKFDYGRKWTMEKMKKSTVLLPSKTDGTPDWDWMESYIKSLPYSDRI